MREKYLFQTQIWRTGVKLAGLAVLCGSLANAGQVLYWQDFILGTSAVPGAITLAGDTGTAATSDTNFDSLLTSQSWSAVIISIQNLPLSSDDSSILGDLTTYVNNGGLLIGDDYDTANGGDTGFSSLFQATEVDSNAASVTNDGSPLFNNITGDIDLSNPGWTVYDVTYDPTGTATAFGHSGGGNGIIEGSSGTGTTFLNGPLVDTYTDLGQGEQLIANELAYASSSGPPPAVPEPGTMVLFGAGLAVLTVYQRHRRRA